jgi:beta-glucosidase
MVRRAFPSDFLWGCATAAHQVEGGNHGNDWWPWEQEAGHIRDGNCSDPACDHYSRYDSDFALLRSLNQNAHRLSVEWSRIEISPGQYSDAALAHYREVLSSLRRHGLEPMVTLHHFTIPAWLAARGGWLDGEAPVRFAGFVSALLEAVGDLARFWITINEPTVVAYQGYLRGEWPPGHLGRFDEAVRALGGLIKAHWLAYEAIKRRQPESMVGVAHHVRVFDPARWWSPLDRMVAAAYHRIFNDTVIRALREGELVFPLDRAGAAHGPSPSQDFLGLNYYTRDLVRFDRHARSELYGRRELRPGALRSDLGWEVYPQGLAHTLRRLRRERLPIYITENGIADATDRLRPGYLTAHLRAAAHAIRDGVPLRGYFHWTCFDNFEWAEGYAAKFGLMECDPSTQERRPRPSARLYAEICRTGELPDATTHREPGGQPRPASAPSADRTR